jgi:hypothetical protein
LCGVFGPRTRGDRGGGELGENRRSYIKKMEVDACGDRLSANGVWGSMGYGVVINGYDGS